MRLSRRSTLSLAVFLTVAGLIVAGWSLEARRAGRESLSNTISLRVTNGADRGTGTLREALFVAATAPGPARISLEVPRISLATALPPIVNPHGMHIVAREGRGEIDAQALRGGPVLDIAAPNVSLEGLAISRCAGAAILVRAVHVSLQSATLDRCDIGVDVAENAHDLLLESNHFVDDRIGVRFTAASPDTTVAQNQFTGEKEAGVWAVHGQTDLQGGSISVRGNRFDDDHSAIIAGNVKILIEQNEITGAQAAAVDLVGAGAVVRRNRVSNGSGMGIVAEGAQAAVIEDNELNGLAAYGIMIRGSSNVLVRGNRMYECAYGMAFVLGDTRNPSTAVDNVIIEPRYDGIDVVGDAPILRQNHVLQPHAFALRVQDFQRPDGSEVRGAPFLDHNSFGGLVAAAATRPSRPSLR
ncbi:MAG: right-handed parallel beta-helix repeat-containing protein [Gammaproteobacteria bacterium]|nr:right-handed parallel beta-helix repeat-containing protein [Gammaproteobacteria bacterium]